MDFTLTETQTELRDLADRIIGDHATVDRVREVEREAATGGDGIDRALWRALAGAGILRAFAEPDSGVDVVDAALVCEAQGRHVAPVPLWPTLAALLVLRGAGAPCSDPLAAVVEGHELVTVALAEAGQTAPGHGSVEAAAPEAFSPPKSGSGPHLRGQVGGGGTPEAFSPPKSGSGPHFRGQVGDGGGGEARLTGVKLSVPAAPVARWVVVPVAHPAPALHLVDLAGEGAAVERVVTTDRGVAGHVRLDGAPSIRVGGPELVDRLLAVATVLVCAVHLGVCAEAVRRTAGYLGTREQFGRPLASFQGPVLRIADAHIDTEAMRVTLLQAAWRLATGRPAAEAVATAKWWAADAGHRVVHTAQHLHGGIGADVDYPIHRYFLWGKQLGDTLGGAGAHAAELGRLLAAAARTGAAA